MKYCVSFFVLIAGILFLSACAGDPRPTPVPVKEQVAEQVEKPVEEPARTAPMEPEGHAPLVGTRWSLETLHGDMRTYLPPRGPMWVEFRRDGTFFAQGPVNTITGGYTHTPDASSPRTGYNFEEGRLRGNGIVRNRRAGTFSDFEDVLLENLQLLKGYYIHGETYAESTLTIWGGYGSEEVILLELAAPPAAAVGPHAPSPHASGVPGGQTE